jgi:membrane-associated phospholipid phosphatase
MSPNPPQEGLHEHIESIAENTERDITASRRTKEHVRHVGGILLSIYAIQLSLFGMLAWLVHVYPVNPIDTTITREFQENPATWLKVSMDAVSFGGNIFVIPCLVLLAALIFWFAGLRLEAVFVVALSLISFGVNTLLKILVARPRPSSHLVDVFQATTGLSFPSGHVMAYMAFWGLLFSFGIILFRGTRWWRIALLIVSAFFVALIGPSRIYLGDHWASDVLGAYLIGGVLLGIALWIYIKLKERGIMETERARTRPERSNAFRSFDTK